MWKPVFATDLNAEPDMWPNVVGGQQLSAALLEQISRAGQTGVLRFWDELSPGEQAAFAHQLAQVDWDLVARWRSQDSSDGERGTVQRANPPNHWIRCAKTATEAADRLEAHHQGEALLRSGKLGVVLVAGGMATRLGVSQPKGMFPIAPVSGRSLFQLFAEQVVALSRRYQVSIPYLIMTSDATHDETVSWFAEHASFGLDPADLFFFRQGSEPAFDAQTGELLLASKSSLALSPDGHGGVLAAMTKSSLFAELKRRGVETLFYHQVDNPLVHVCDPVFVGYHARHGADVSTKVVSKRSPDERVGVVVEIDGRSEIVEYSDLPADLAAARDPDGELRFRAGNTAIHLFQRAFLERTATAGTGLPWHRVLRRNSFVDAVGRVVHPDHVNAVKFERFIFDVLPLAKTSLVVETEREREFAPLKNAEGECSPVEVQRAMTAVATIRLNAAGISVAEGVAVEICPLAAGPDDELKLRDDCPRHVVEPRVFNGSHLDRI